MDPTRRAKIVQFISDQRMNDAVFNVIRDVFLKPGHATDVHFNASRFLALEQLQLAWRELERYKIDADKETEARTPHV